jgi:hypothetical protein
MMGLEPVAAAAQQPLRAPFLRLGGLQQPPHHVAPIRGQPTEIDVVLGRGRGSSDEIAEEVDCVHRIRTGALRSGRAAGWFPVAAV